MLARGDVLTLTRKTGGVSMDRAGYRKYLGMLDEDGLAKEREYLEAGVGTEIEPFMAEEIGRVEDEEG